ncbi:MAG: hypothetical protein ABI162_07135 [Luteolibacter sp.]
MQTAEAQPQFDYWKGVAPTTTKDHFRRWLFAYASVHSTWKSNVRTYNAIKDLGWISDPYLLWSTLMDSRGGLYNDRAKTIWKFKEQFFRNPEFFTRRGDETWPQARDRIAAGISGLGPAKTSFALELCFPLEAEVVCLDVHMLRLYGKAEMNGRSGKKFLAEYRAMEKDWVGRSLRNQVPSYVSRCIYWDTLMKQPDSRYWSHCLENN